MSNNNNKGDWNKLLGVMDMPVAFMVVMVLWVSTHQVVHIKYAQLFYFLRYCWWCGYLIRMRGRKWDYWLEG